LHGRLLRSKRRGFVSKGRLHSDKKLNRGKFCIRFKKLEDVFLSVVGQMVKRITVKKFIANYEKAIDATAARKPVGKKKSAVTSTTHRKSFSVKSSAKKKAGNRKFGSACATASTRESASRKKS